MTKEKLTPALAQASVENPGVAGGAEKKSASSNPDPRQLSRRHLAAWMIGVTRSVTRPLALSALFRILDQSLGMALFGLAGYGVVQAYYVWTQGSAAPATWLQILLPFVVLAMVKGAARYFEQFSGHWVAFKSLELLRQEMFRKLWPQAPAVVATTHSGDLLTRATKDIDRIEVFFAHTLAPAIAALVVPTAAVTAVALWASPALALVAAIGLALVIFVIPFLGAGRLKRALDEASASRGRIGQYLTDTVQGRREVRGYGQEAARLEGLAALDRTLQAQQITQFSLEALRRGLSRLTWGGTVFALAYVGAAQVSTAATAVPSSHTAALLVASILALVRCFEAARGVEDFSVELERSFAAAARVYQVVHAAPLVCDHYSAAPSGWRPGNAQVRFENVSFTYPGSARPALENLSFTAPAAGRTCLVGPSGAGKSTAVSLLLRYFDPDQGRIYLGEVPIDRLPQDELRRAIAMVTQNTYLFNDTVAANLRLGAPQASDEELRQACEIAGLWEEIEQMEAGLQTPIAENGARLSGGQRQRLSLARALLSEAQVFVLDEFTSHLNPQLEEVVRRRLRQARPQATIIEITHRPSATEGAQAVVDFGSEQRK